MKPSPENPCQRFEPLLSGYLLKEIAEGEEKEVAAHLEGCTACREELDLLSSAADQVRRSAPVERGLRSLEREKLLRAAGAPAKGSGRPAARQKKALYWFGGLAAAALIAVGVFSFLAPSLLHEKKKDLLAVREPETRAAPSPAFEKLPAPDQVRTVSGLLTPPKETRKEVEDLARTLSEPLQEEREKPVEVALEKQGDGLNDSVGLGGPMHSVQELAPSLATRNPRPDSGFAYGKQDSFLVAQGEKPAAEKERAELSYNLPKSLRSVPSDRRWASADGIELREANLNPPSPTAKQPVLLRIRPTDKAAETNEFYAQPGGSTRESKAPEGPAVAQEDSKSGLLPKEKRKEELVLARSQAEPAARAPAQPAALAPSQTPPVDWKARVDEFLSRLDRKPGETPDMMFFRYWGDNPFVEASSDPLSTFGVDVDTASYTLMRSYLYKQSVLPPREAIRTEEFINYFKSRYPPPAEAEKAFALHAEMAPSPFAHEPGYRLLKVGLKGREVPREKRKACSLVFVVDTSGSMRRENRLELVKDALRLLVKELDEGDTIGIVAFDRDARTVLDPTPASQKEKILDAISTLQPRQNTNVNAGLEMGYQMAGSHRLKDGSNRVILLSDGVANTGLLDPNAMLERIRGERERGVYLTCVGVGMGNMNDALLEQLADRGNGQCVYVDRIEEAQKVFVESLTGTLEAIARDVKIQVEFDPQKVIRYRLLGYENRAIADSAFRDNTVDAGEVGAGHEVTALYELKTKPESDGKLATVRVRYLTVDHGEAVEIERAVSSGDSKGAFADASPRFQLAACVAEFAEVLRDSYWARGSTLDRVASMVESILPKLDGDQDAVELVALLKKADALVRQRESATDEVARTVEAIKDNYYLRTRIEDEVERRRDANRAQLEDILRQNNDLRRRLEDLLTSPR